MFPMTDTALSTTSSIRLSTNPKTKPTTEEMVLTSKLTRTTICTTMTILTKFSMQEKIAQQEVNLTVIK